MTSGYVPPKDEPGFDAILEALGKALQERPQLAEMPTEEVARELAAAGYLEDEPSPPLVAEALQSHGITSKVDVT